MTIETGNPGATLEILSRGAATKVVRITESPFLIGRGAEAGNHLQLDDRRISRRCAAIVGGVDGYHLEDRGNSQGVFVNGVKVEQKALQNGDVIDFGMEDCCEIVFRSIGEQVSIDDVLSRIGSLPELTGSQPAGGLSRLNLLLEATSLLHSQLPLDSVLGSMLQHAIGITQAERGLLLEPNEGAGLKVRLARDGKGESLPPESFTPSQTALKQAIDRRAAVITDDLNLADAALQNAASIVVQRLRAVVVIPLFATLRANADESAVLAPGELLGVVYLDSRHVTAFSAIDRQILDALGTQAASILDNARLVEYERERQRMEQELTIARDIQQALVPQGLRDFPHLAVTGGHYPCHAVGGDYYDVFPLSDDRTAILIADVAGKGIGAALLTAVLQGALSGMTLGVDPVRVFNHINQFLCEHSGTGRYATMFFAIISRDGTLEYIPGGHPSPLLLRKGVVTELFDGGSFPVGLVDGAEYAATRVQLEPDDTLVLFSDGVTEAEDGKRTLFGTERLCEAVAGRENDSIDDLRRHVLDCVNTWSRGTAQSDDITVLIVRYRTPA
ncbi:MAG TPA: SpoIIE family protein phosphatase [Terracidiphilus sp.]|jgi:serine phosphatase RsbU (regulator of sigma subunit)|nr:SpoIIE family protein phosphatase [Terracidiphilus sp.]HEX4283582.1 SpoIIE family protein phosphatase [Terracidiphilus sp.]